MDRNSKLANHRRRVKGGNKNQKRFRGENKMIPTPKGKIAPTKKGSLGVSVGGTHSKGGNRGGVGFGLGKKKEAT